MAISEPTSVFFHPTFTMSNPRAERKYIEVAGHGYDLELTMEKFANLARQGRYSELRANWMIEKMMDLKEMRADVLDGSMRYWMSPRADMYERLTRMQFWRRFGVKVNISFYHEQEARRLHSERTAREEAVFEAAMVEAAVAVEDAHLLWNLWNDGTRSVETTMESRSLSEDEIHEMLNDPLGDITNTDDDVFENEHEEDDDEELLGMVIHGI